MDDLVASVAPPDLDQDPFYGNGTLISAYGQGFEWVMGMGDVVPGPAGVHSGLSYCCSEIICHG